jgi:hypothetical protein
LARIDYIAAANQALVYCLVTWFYLPAQLRELGIPTVRRPKFLKGEVYLSDHREVIETSTVDCECFFRSFLIRLRMEGDARPVAGEEHLRNAEHER